MLLIFLVMISLVKTQFTNSLEINDTNVEQFIRKMSRIEEPMFLFAYSRECEYSQQVFKEWDRLEKRIERHKQSGRAQGARYNLRNLSLSVLDVNENRMAKKRLNIKVTPTFYLFKNGKFYDFGHIRRRKVEGFGQFIYKESEYEFGMWMPWGQDECQYLMIIIKELGEFIYKVWDKKFGWIWELSIIVIGIVGRVLKMRE